MNYRWCATYDKITKNYYAHTTLYGNGERIRITLHEIIMNCKHIDHIDHDSKNNTKLNLRPIDYINNATNRKSKNINNTSGYRNVIYDKKRKKYKIMLCVNSKRFQVGKYYDDVDEAGRDAEMYRKQYYGEEFSGED